MLQSSVKDYTWVGLICCYKSNRYPLDWCP